MDIGPLTFEAFLDEAADFHGYPAPGIVIGAYMVEFAKSRMPEGCLFEALVETPKCLPDAVQLLTLCTIGNGRLRIVNWGIYALSLYDKFTGEGFRVSLDPALLEMWPEIKAWLLKTKPKKEQDHDRLFEEIRRAGSSICRIKPARVDFRLLGKKDMGEIGVCPICREAFPVNDGGICRKCQGESMFMEGADIDVPSEGPRLKAVPVEDAVGKAALHDMTRIVPEKSKGPELRKGEAISAGDICRLQQMGRNRVYTVEDNDPGPEWLHEDEAVLAFAEAMAGEGIEYALPPKEGKIDFTAAREGLFVFDKKMLTGFNLVPDVMCSARQNFTVVEKGRNVAGCRALPLYLARTDHAKAMAMLAQGPLFKVMPMRSARVGILVTGTEVFQGLIEDRFIPIIKSKVEKLGCRVIGTDIVPDSREKIVDALHRLRDAGSDLIVTTAGLSVDPDDVTREALVDAGAEDLLFGAPILPGAMTLVGRIGDVQVFGVPACALFYQATSFDLLLPRLLAGLTVTRLDLAEMADGGYCLNCKSCTFPKCPFGK